MLQLLSTAGLLLQLPSTGEWIPIEERMGHDEAILFCGSTLAELSSVPALRHKALEELCICSQRLNAHRFASCREM